MVYVVQVMMTFYGQEQILLLTSNQQTCMTYTIAPCVQWKTPDDGQRNCPKHVEFKSKIKFSELVHLVGFIIRERQKHFVLLTALELPLPISEDSNET